MHAEPPPDEYVFSAPVRIENARSISAATVDCLVSFYRDRTAAGIATGAASVPVVDGAYSGTVIVIASIPPASRREDQTPWRRRLALQFNDGRGHVEWITANLTEEDQVVWYTRELEQAEASHRLNAGLRADASCRAGALLQPL
jgi:hypothetical protein